MKRLVATTMLAAAAILGSMIVAQDPIPEPTTIPPRLPVPRPRPTTTLPLPLPTPISTAIPFPTPAPTVAQTGNKPNIILILADDLDATAYDVKVANPISGGRQTALDNVTQLIRIEGAWLPNFLLSQALCCPSRTSILLGQYVHNHQVFGNKPKMNPTRDGGFEKFEKRQLQMSTIATWLQAESYRTGLFGKYLNGYPAGRGETYIPRGWNRWFVNVANTDSGPYFNYRANVNGIPMNFNGDANYNTTKIGDQAIEFMQDAKRRGQPFFAFVAPHAPHLPALPQTGDAGTFAMAPPPGDAFNELDMSDKPLFFRSLKQFNDNQINEIGRIRGTRLDSLVAVDRLVKRLVNTLTASGELANTYIFFTTDNGYHLGQHRLRPAKGTAFEEDIRFPLAVRGPGIARETRITDLVANIDLAPTFLHIARDGAGGLVPSSGGRSPDGRSLLPLLRGAAPAGERRQAFLLERFPTAVPAATPTPPEDDNEDDDDVAKVQFTSPEIPPYVGVRTQRYTFVRYATGARELYDVIADPGQLCNLILQDPPQTCEISPPPVAPSAAFVQALSDRAEVLRTCCSGDGCTEQQRCSTIENMPFLTTPAPTPIPQPTRTPPPFPTPTPLPTATPRPSATPTPSPTPTPTPPPPSGGGALVNGGFEAGAAPWAFNEEATFRSGDGGARTGAGYARVALASFGGDFEQTFTVPCTATSLSFQLAVETRINSTVALDRLFVELTEPANRLLRIFANYSNLNAGGYQLRGPFDVTAFRCQTVKLRFRGSPSPTFGGATTFRVDDVIVQ